MADHWKSGRNATIAAAVRSGRSCADVAREFGLSRERVREIVMRVKRQEQGALMLQQVDEVHRLRFDPVVRAAVIAAAQSIVDSSGAA